MPVTEHAGDVTPPIASGPAQTLFQEFGIVFERRQDFRLFMMLIGYFLPMRNKPSGDEVVVISVELVLTEPLFMGELICKRLIPKNAGPVGHGPSG